MLTPISNFQAGSDVWEGVNMVETKAGFLALKILRSSALCSSTRIRDDHFSAFDSRPKLAPDETIRKILPPPSNFPKLSIDVFGEIVIPS